MKKLSFRAILRSINNYAVFFFTVSFAVSCCMMLFVTTLANTMGLEFTTENISQAAKLTFGNIALITLIFAAIDRIRRMWLVDRPVRIITEAAQRITQGDFSVHIPPMKGSGAEGFDQIGEAINTMVQELRGVDTLRTDFIANVSHEMKTPLAVLQNYGTLLQAPVLSDEKRIEYAKGASDGARRLAEMVTNILKLNRLENQQIFPQTLEFDLGEQLCACLLQFENVWETAGINIETDIADDIKVKADAELLSLVWNNLFSNAFKFTKTGGKVSVSLQATAHHAIVTVKDTGCGMPPEIGAHIFEKFYQGDPSHTTRGNGLGLALVKRVIDILTGEIHVESAVGVGSVFTVKIRRF